jgi:hypothetical protein
MLEANFFNILKQELLLRGKYETRQSALQDNFKRIETWYSRHQRHSYLGYESPDNLKGKPSATTNNNSRLTKLYEKLGDGQRWYGVLTRLACTPGWATCAANNRRKK